jgi:tetratricopeptide (TPR) repeat protein
MRRIFALALALSLIPALSEAAPARTASTHQAAGQTAAEKHEARLDKLFAELKREDNADQAKVIANQIWAEWRDSGSATIDLLMQWSGDAVKKQNYAAALDFLDQVTVLEPDFAEGWNQRATVHFLMHNYAKSMADIDRTLMLEPRHFGALSGMGAIFSAIGKKKLALAAYERALAVYPMMRTAQKQVLKLTEEIAGSPI